MPAQIRVTSLSEPWYRATYDGARRLVAASPARPHLRIDIRLPRLRRF